MKRKLPTNHPMHPQCKNKWLTREQRGLKPLSELMDKEEFLESNPDWTIQKLNIAIRNRRYYKLERSLEKISGFWMIDEKPFIERYNLRISKASTAREIALEVGKVQLKKDNELNRIARITWRPGMSDKYRSL